MSTTKETIRETVRERYGSIARGAQQGCGCLSSKACCSPKSVASGSTSLALGYSQEDLAQVPQGADLGLGCGNPQAIAGLLPGETILDLGSGAGFDCFLAAKAVGPQGHVIGVDMTPDMIRKARDNAASAGVSNVEFRLGEIEHLPVADQSVDAIISNCVINLSPEKQKVYAEAFRVLKPGGRLAISDVVALQPLPDRVRQDLSLLSACIGGAAEVADLERMLVAAGFSDIRVRVLPQSAAVIRDWFPESGFESFIASATIQASKPEGRGGAFPAA